ncbi:hypothetical protein CHLRE_07g346917v5 [Chlamydomonas reinhardtii]|uniref:Uncharacterized protein n=1 Tax=Chlamydomonas reinhardtii TaxID=3055 RepID=A0A2K3DL04_CHLRE|nr:uncharacterized protein CHLRE_07g346917v5 [Chlamydomonas reinhardtii]PNW81216.1 hypothetical protein CHLRE_07g346917v5 [Chlamydomonas reinhardtii]
MTELPAVTLVAPPEPGAWLARGLTCRRALSLPAADIVSIVSATAESVQQVVRGLGWLQCGGPPILLTAYTVKAGTVLQWLHS